MIQFNIQNKKGTLRDMFFLLPILFVIAISILLGIKILNSINDTGFTNNDPNADAIMDIGVTRVLPSYDVIFMGIILAIAIVTILSAYLLRESPAFFFIGVLMIMILEIIAVVLSNAYDAITNESAFATTVNTVPQMDFIMNWLPLIMLGFSALVLIVIYGLRGE